MNYVAIDLGAESVRTIVGSLDGDKLSIEEVHRFPNILIRNGSSIRWDISMILHFVLSGLESAVLHSPKSRFNLQSISADSWGVDYVFLDSNGCPQLPVYNYRDPRTNWSAPELLRKISWPEIFSETGIQYMPINTLFQLAAETPERISTQGTLP